MSTLIYHNERLHSLYEAPESKSGSVALGRPLTVRYLYFALRHEARRRQQLMVSTFVKTEEQKPSAVEAVNYFNPSARFGKDGTFRLADFGGQHYGHPLCYYTRSYIGETVRLTTKVMELDKLDRKAMDAVRSGLATIASLPVFTEFLAYSALVYTGFRAAEKLIEFLNRDDAIIESHNLDLAFDQENSRRLQPGRVVCIPGADAVEFIESESWQLAPDNRLREASTGREYDRGSYFVLEIDTREHPTYEKFEYHQATAELLRRTNRGDDPADLVDFGVEVARGYQDYQILNELESFLLLPREDAPRDRAAALFRLLTPRLQQLYEPRLRLLLG